MAGYVKIYGDKLISSTVWVNTDKETKLVWIALLSMADAHGIVSSSVPGLAKMAEVTLEECENALAIFRAPDAHSRTKTHEGRRIIDVDGGFFILNHKKYREMRTDAQVKEAERKANWRANQKDDPESGEPRDVSQDIAVSRASTTPSPSPSPVSKDIKPSASSKNLPVVRDHNVVSRFVADLGAEDWNRNRSKNEAFVAFNFFRWISKTKNRMTFPDQRERIAAKLIEQYGLVRVMFAIIGQRSHPDFNQKDRQYFGWDNLFRSEKGYAAIEKCSDYALARRETSKPVLKALAQLQEERGWYPSEADAELFESIGGASV